MGVVLQVLEQRAAEALHHGADRLAIRRERIDHAPDVLDHQVIDELHMAGTRIDRDMRCGSAVGIGVQVPGERALRALGTGCLQFLRSIQDRRAAHHHRARMEGTEAFLEIRGRAVQHADLFHRQVERLGGDLRAHGFQALPDVGRADVNGGTAAPVELDARVLARPGGAAFDEARQRHAVVAALHHAPVELHLLRPIELRQAAIQRRGVIAAIELLLLFRRRDGGERVGHLVGPRQVAPAEFDRIDAEVLGGHVEQALTEEVGLEAPRAAVGAHRRLVGEQRMRLDVDVGHAIRAGEELRDVARRDRAVGAHIGAHVDPRRAAQRDDASVALAQELDLAVHLARVVRGEQVLAAVLGPFHRAP